MFGKNAFLRSWPSQFLPTLLLITGMTVSAAPPAWWSQVGADGHTVIDPAASDPNPKGPANIGQAKFMAKRALESLRSIVPDTANRIETDLVGSGKIIPTWDVPAAGSEVAQTQRSPLRVGQLKAIAAPYYKHLHALDSEWLETQLQTNQTKAFADSANYYPWVTATTNDANRAIATIGQLKAVFSLGFESLNPNRDSDGDGLSNTEEIAYGSNPSNPDSDDDGLTDAQEKFFGTNPNTADNQGMANGIIMNGDFSKSGSGPGSSHEPGWDYWNGIPGWTAVNGSNIELQTIWPKAPDDPYCELKAHPAGSSGITQLVPTVAGKTYILAIDCKARPDVDSSQSVFKVRIDETDFKTIAPTTDWTTQMVVFTATNYGTDIALLAVNNPDNTVGCLVDNVRFLQVEVAVDADRNGEIEFGKDNTTDEKPYRFWINDDDDDLGNSGHDGTFDHVPVVEPDYQNSRIDYTRDLEDFARLSFRLDSLWGQIKSGEIQVGFKWSDTSGGNPSINIFRQTDQSGGPIRYFVDEDEAVKQSSIGFFEESDASKVITISGTASTYLPKSFIDKLPSSSVPVYLLFEGAAKGKGKFNIVLKVNGEEFVCGGPLIKLMDVCQFYQRGRTNLTAGQISDPWDNFIPPAITSIPVEDPQSPFTPDPDETQQCIIHVHGWRMTNGDSKSWSEMTFKRLWQLHYKGRFATFRWATFSDDTHPPILGVPQSILTYNRSEYRSWLCGSALAQFVNGLPYPGYRYLVAHSMGNVISGKALLDGMKVDRYVMCNAAMAAMSYDDEITNAPLSLAVTPDTDSDPSTQALGLKNRFNDNLTTRINYYLPDDDALQSWIANQLVNKPEGFLDSTYGYNPNETPGNKIYYSDTIFRHRRNVTGLAEAVGHVVRSRSHAIGAVGYANGCISSKVGMDSYGFEDEHSAEWNWSLTASYKFWRKLFDSFDIPTTAPQSPQ